MAIFSHIWNLLGYIGPFILVLSVVVFFHELGHFLVGRWCGVKVETFSLGFGPQLFAFTDRRGTVWRLALLPLGGYVKFFGDSNGASVADSDGVALMSAADRAVAFPTQSVAKRAAIVAAGPIANFLLALVIFMAGFMIIGRPSLKPEIAQVRQGDAADRAGLLAGDLIVSINGIAIEGWGDMQRIVQSSAGVPLDFVIKRGNEQKSFVVTPEGREVSTPVGKSRVGQVGVIASSAPSAWTTERFGPVGAFVQANKEVWFIIERTGSYIGGVFAGSESADQISGPIRIAEISGTMAQAGPGALISLIAILSVSVGLMNLLPVPLLDGGHLLYYGIEALKGGPLSKKVQDFGYRVGLAFVLGLMIFATCNDILHLSPWK